MTSRRRRVGSPGRPGPAPGRCAAAGAGPEAEAVAPATEAVRGLDAADGETILLVLGRSARVVAIQAGLSLLAGAGLCATVIVILAGSPRAGSLSSNLWAIGLAWVALTAWFGADWLSRRFVLTDRRVVVLGRWGGRLIAEAPLSSVRAVRSAAARPGRWLDVGSVSCSDAEGGHLLMWDGVNRPARARSAIAEAARRYARVSVEES